MSLGGPETNTLLRSVVPLPFSSEDEVGFVPLEPLTVQGVACIRPALWRPAVTLDGRAHLEQVSVNPEHAGRRIGAPLIDEVDRWAHTRGDDVLTLTTFADVPWNAPYDYRLGFRPIDTPGPELAAALDHEKRRFPGFARLAMARPVRGPLRP